MKFALVFPGQGAQYVGMGKELAEHYGVARELFRQADEVLGFSLSDMCFNGPEDVLRQTYHTQPALLTVSTIAHQIFQAEANIVPIVAAGHSLGEYSALVAAGALSFADGVKLVHQRGRWMDEAVPSGVGAMSAVLGLDVEPLAAVCEEASQGEEIVELANLNCPGQIVISGTAKAVQVAGELAKERGARRVIPLEVSGPFHSRLMQPASGNLRTMLKDMTLNEAEFPIVANVDSVLRTSADDMKDALVMQLYKPVRWEDNVRTMLELGVEGFIEFGPGTVLSGLIKKVDRRIPTFHVEDEASLQETLQAIRA